MSGPGAEHAPRIPPACSTCATGLSCMQRGRFAATPPPSPAPPGPASSARHHPPARRQRALTPHGAQMSGTVPGAPVWKDWVQRLAAEELDESKGSRPAPRRHPRPRPRPAPREEMVTCLGALAARGRPAAEGESGAQVLRRGRGRARVSALPPPPRSGARGAPPAQPRMACARAPSRPAGLTPHAARRQAAVTALLRNVEGARGDASLRALLNRLLVGSGAARAALLAELGALAETVDGASRCGSEAGPKTLRPLPPRCSPHPARARPRARSRARGAASGRWSSWCARRCGARRGTWGSRRRAPRRR